MISLRNVQDIRKITIEDKSYPKLLKEIKNAPKILYYRGSLPQAEENCFAIVGTRLYSTYGKQLALEIAGDLAGTGLTIVSGLAPGIDAFCHQATVEQGKRTIAVLGTGLDEKSIYPQSNLKLVEKILEIGGCLISEYPPGTRGTQFTFPQRNRMVAGLSLGVLVVESKIKGGALITAEWAKRYKRKVFAVPGSVYSSNSKGCHYLIKQGAKLAENANDILKELNINLSIDKNNKFNKSDNKEEVLILKILKEGSLDVDKIIERTKLPAPKVASLLAVLEIKGNVRNLGGNIYAISHC